jgi:colanic acid biosynthesis glycosyl transferase WcaI
MRILVHDYGRYSFSVQLSRELADRGHSVLHLYAGYNTTPSDLLGKFSSNHKSFNIEPIFISQPLQKYSFVKRLFQEREYGRLLAGKIERYQPDVVLSANTPLDAQLVALKLSHKLSIPFVFWLQDVIGIATEKILKKRIPIAGGLVGKHYIRLERRMLAQSDHVISITDDFMPLMREWGIDESKIDVIPNWAPLEQIPIVTKENSWSQEHRLVDKFCFMYTGTLGLKHNPALLLQLARHFQYAPSVRVVVVSEGMGADWLGEQKRKYSLGNLLIEKYLPFELLFFALSTANVLVGILEEDAGVFSVPSKVLTYLCARRPLLLAVPAQNLAARIVTQNNAGIIVNSNNDQAFISAAERLYKDASMRDHYGQNGRAYAEHNFDIKVIADRFESSLLTSYAIRSR